MDRALLERLIENVRRDGCHFLIACTTFPNAPSFKLRERLGYKKAPHIRHAGKKFLGSTLRFLTAPMGALSRWEAARHALFSLRDGLNFLQLFVASYNENALPL